MIFLRRNSDTSLNNEWWFNQLLAETKFYTFSAKVEIYIDSFNEIMLILSHFHLYTGAALTQIAQYYFQTGDTLF